MDVYYLIELSPDNQVNTNKAGTGEVATPVLEGIVEKETPPIPNIQDSPTPPRQRDNQDKGVNATAGTGEVATPVLEGIVEKETPPEPKIQGPIVPSKQTDYQESSKLSDIKSPPPINIPQKQELQLEKKVETVDRRLAPGPKKMRRGRSSNGNNGNSNRPKHYPQSRTFSNSSQISPYNRTITDLQGQAIGQVITTEKTDKPGEYIAMGDTTFLGDISFDFTYTRHMGHLIRATAYITDRGIDHLTNYMMAYRMRKAGVRGRQKRKHIDRQRVKSNIKKSMKGIKAYNIDVDGIKTHINLDGKIEIFVSYPAIGDKLAGIEGLSANQQIRLSKHTRYAKLKQWIRATDRDTNLFIGRAMTNLAHVVSHIYANHTQSQYLG
jgi:hypothetical protein